jgi:ATP-dependent RNA helicase SUPV3L1/SUV3
LRALEKASREEGLGAAARGIVFRLHEALGLLGREEVASLLPDLPAEDRAALGRLGVRFGWHHVFLPALLKPAAVEARVRLWRLARAAAAPVPPPGRTVLRGDEAPPPEAAFVAGFASLPGFALRVDVLERLAASVRALSRVASPFKVPPELASGAGLGRAELATLVEALGFRPVVTAEGEAAFARPSPRRGGPERRPSPAERKRRAAAGPAVASSSPFAVLAGLKAAP